MSSAIYEDLSDEIYRERVEMMVDIYESAEGVRDQDYETNTHQTLQNTGRSHAKNRSSRAALVCLVLLCFLLTGVIALSAYIYYTNYIERNQLSTKITNLTEERDELLTNNINFLKEKDQLLTNITNLTEDKDQLLTNNTNLTKKKDRLLTNVTNLTKEKNKLLTNIANLNKEKNQLLSNITNLVQLNAELILKKQEQLECFRGTGGWKMYQSNCYFISSEKKNWIESRRDCRKRGADLIIINDRQEQKFAEEMSVNDAVWIGLTDRDEEGRWKWVDGTELDYMVWKSGEPNGHRGENCALNYMSWWYDYPCNYSFKWICEKNILQ